MCSPAVAPGGGLVLGPVACRCAERGRLSCSSGCVAWPPGSGTTPAAKQPSPPWRHAGRRRACSCFAAATSSAARLRRPCCGAVRVESAGFTAPGRPSPPHAVTAAARHGVDLAGHSSQLVVADLARAADLIVVMEELQRRSICERFGRSTRDVLLLGDLDPLPVTSRAIQDPVDQRPEVCERVYARIERCVGELARALTGSSGSSARR